MNKRNIRTLKRKKERKRIRFIIFLSLLSVLVVVGSSYAIRHGIPVREIIFTGNKHLKNEELLSLLNIKVGDALFGVSQKELYKRLKRSPWIREAVIRKEMSGRILVNVSEAEPVAILEMNAKPFLIDKKGVLLEEMKEGTMLFLPVIKDIDPYKNMETYGDVVEFVNVLQKKGMPYTGNIEIEGQRPEDIALKIDDITIKIGHSEFERKLEKLAFIKDEIDRRNMSVEYIDLRFVDKVVVKTKEQNTADVKKVASPVINKTEKKSKPKKKKNDSRKKKKQ